MATFLLLETSSEICSVALSREGDIVQEKSITEPNAHSSHLASFVREILEAENIQPHHLDAVVLSSGPGSYTGLRIGCSLAKGICFGTDIPLIAVSTLRAMAYAAREEFPNAETYIALVDARRMDAYMGIYDASLKTIEPEVFITINDALDLHYENAVVVGSGATKFLRELGLEGQYSQVSSGLYAKHLLDEAIQKWKARTYVDLVSFEPNYIKSVYTTKPKPKF